MAKSRVYFREWRKHLGLTQTRAAERLEISQGHLSDLETGKKPWSQEIVEAMAHAYSCEVWELFARNPLKSGDVVSLDARLNSIPEAERERAARVASGALDAFIEKAG